MKFGVRLKYGLRPEEYREAARSAERLGFESLWTGDHLVLPRDYASAYPYGTFPADSHLFPLQDSLNLLGHLAAVTQRIRLAVGVYILPLRSPFATAGAVRTLDYLSGGRAMLGVGVGWLREEFDIVGQSFVNRGARTDECIQVMRTLWSAREPTFDGRFYAFPAVGFEPKPVQKPYPPIFIGGESKAALRRAGRLGDGWFAHQQPAADLRTKIAFILEERAAWHADAEPFEVSVRVPVRTPLGDVEAMAVAGVDRLVLAFGDVKQPEDGARFVSEIEQAAHRYTSYMEAVD